MTDNGAAPSPAAPDFERRVDADADDALDRVRRLCRRALKAEDEAKRLREALDTLYHVVGLTAIKYPGQLAALNEAVDVARAALAAQPEAGR